MGSPRGQPETCAARLSAATPPSPVRRSIVPRIDLFSVSTQTAIHEVLEASRFQRDGILCDASLINLQHTTSIGKDAGAGNDKARTILQGALGGKTAITPGSLAAATLELGAADLEANYLKRWLYRLRNLVAHGARTDSIVLEAGAGAAAPLVGAAFDRIHHAAISRNLSPVELIARARTRIAMLDAKTTSERISLLDCIACSDERPSEAEPAPLRSA